MNYSSAVPNDVLNELARQAKEEAEVVAAKDALAAKKQAMAQANAQVAGYVRKAKAALAAVLVTGAAVGSFFAVRRWRKHR